jgi:hypothetical protein
MKETRLAPVHVAVGKCSEVTCEIKTMDVRLNGFVS